MTTTSTKIRTVQHQEGGPSTLPPSFSSVSSSPESSSTTETKRSLPTSDAESEDDTSPTSPSKKAKTATASLKKPNIAEENALLLELKDGKSMKWPEIVDAFREYGWVGRKTGLLKNRYKSIKEGTVFWEDDDVDIMYQAIFHVERKFERTKWNSIAEKMVKLGASRKFTGAACEKKFRAKADSKKKIPEEEEGLGEASGGGDKEMGL